MTRLDEVKTLIEDDLTPFRSSEVVLCVYGCIHDCVYYRLGQVVVVGSTQDMAFNIKMC